VKRITGYESVGDVHDCKPLFYVESKMLSDIVSLLLSSPALVAGDSDCQYPSSNLCKVYSLFPTCYFTSRKQNDSLIVSKIFRTVNIDLVGITHFSWTSTT